MTPYSQISQNKAKTFFIIALFVAIVTGFFFIAGTYFDSSSSFLLFGLVFSLVSTAISYFYSDKIVLATVSARPASKKEYFDFYTVTENLALASGLPPPKLYVISDPSPNAFATGRDPKHAVVAATTGLLEKLDRRELEGVIAHELSHVKNYDILVSSIVAVLVGTVAVAADWMMRSLWWGGMSDGDNRDRRNPLGAIIFVVALILMPIVATLIQLAVSRRREFLADASGALLTRYPEGLARALEKISADPHALRTATASTAHLFFSNPLRRGKRTSWLTTLFSTHPPVDERIRILRNM